jgi:hypothetical protein
MVWLLILGSGPTKPLTITLSGLAAAGGVGITLSSNWSNAAVQSNITVVITTTDVTTATTATITASHRTVSLPGTLTIQSH